MGTSGNGGQLVITNLLLEHPWLSPTALVLMVAFGPILGSWLAHRPALAWSLSGLSLLPVAFLTLVPVGRAPFERCAMQWALPTPGRVELMANVVLFVPPVLLAGVVTRRPVPVLVVASGLSAGLEALQAAFSVLGRSCDTNDWLSNTIGAVIGATLAWVALRRAHPRATPT